MTIREALQWARSRLQASPTPYEDARLLLQHVLSAGHTYLAAHPERSLTDGEEQLFRSAVDRALQLEPIPYITGRAFFDGLDFLVTKDVLIPRPETELLVETAAKWAEDNKAQRIVDVGTGSGCIAISMARRLPISSIIAVDRSTAALEIARQNVLRHNIAGRVHLLLASLLQALAGPIDLIVANLPYVSDLEWTSLDDGVKWYEPVQALRGGPDGLDLIGALLQQATSRLRSDGAIFLEIGWQQGEAARQLAQAYFPTAHINVNSDYAGHDRLVVVEARA